MTRGITSWSVYLPRQRLARSAVAAALAWCRQPTKRAPAGERAYGSWDEDSVTMAVEAARLALHPAPAGNTKAVHLASTTLPFADRSNAGIVADALSLANPLDTQDATGSQRAATGLLLRALGSATGGDTLVVAADRRRTRPGSAEEVAYGDGAAAMLVGSSDVVAEFVGSRSVAVDFVDHYRESDADHDYTLEERWIRAEGYLKLVPDAIRGLLGELATPAAAIRHFILAAPRSTTTQVAGACGIDAEAVIDPLLERCGHTGAAHPLLMLAAALDVARPGELIVMVGFGQGVDVLVLRTTAALAEATPRGAVERALSSGVTDHAYVRFLSHSGTLAMDWGMRAERDTRTAPTVHYRKHRDLNGLVGGRCASCDTVQYPKSRVCVNPACRATDTQSDEILADVAGRVKTFTEDWLAYVPAPPLQYGNVALQGGGNLFIEFADVEPGDLSVGLATRFVFRIKDVDHVRGFHRYFWKATPVRS